MNAQFGDYLCLGQEESKNGPSKESFSRNASRDTGRDQGRAE